MNRLIFLAVFLISLQSLYFHSIGIPLYSVIGIFVLFACALIVNIFHGPPGRWIVPQHLSFQVAAPIILLSLSLIAFIFHLEAQSSRVIAFFAIAILPLSYSLLAHRIDPIKMVSSLVLIHSLVLLIQFGLFFGFGIDFDPVNMLSEVQQRGWGGSVQHSALGGFRRLGGLYSEPGTYATYVAPLVAMLFAHGGVERRQKLAISLGLLSLVLTFSIFAWVFCTIILLVMFTTYFRRSILFVLAVPSMVWLALPYIHYRFFDESGRVADGGVKFRADTISSILEFSGDNVARLMFGSGLFTTKVSFDYVGAFNDIGLVFYGLYTCGLIGLMFLIVTILNASWHYGFAGLAFVLILLISKVSLFAPMFWLILVMSAHLSWSRRE